MGELVAKAVIALELGIAIGGWDRRITAHYGAGMMPRVVQVRREQGYVLPLSSCYIAHPTLPIGTRVQVKGLNTGKTLMCYVADTSEDIDRARHIRTKLIEVGYWEAGILCGSYDLPNRQCPTLVRRMR